MANNSNAAKIATQPKSNVVQLFKIVPVLEVTGTKGDIYTVAFGTYYGEPWAPGWSCTCLDYFYRHRENGTHCKHCVAAAAQFKPY